MLFTTQLKHVSHVPYNSVTPPLSGLRLYLACLAASESILNHNAPYIAHGESNAYYKALLTRPGPDVKRGLNTKQYQALAAGSNPHDGLLNIMPNAGDSVMGQPVDDDDGIDHNHIDEDDIANVQAQHNIII